MTKHVSIEERIEAMRVGYKNKLSMKYGEYEFPVRLLTASEEAKAIAQAIKEKGKGQLDANLGTMKRILDSAATIKSVPYLPSSLLDKLTSAEIEKLYDQYLEICHQIDPELEELTRKELEEMFLAIKKKEMKASELSSRQLKGAGKYFLEEILPKVNELGG